MNQSNLVTTCNFRGKDYLFNLYTDKNNSSSVEIKVTEKNTLEEWQGCFDVSYIENLTHKTGNYKRFDTFVSMLKSGLLGTSQSVVLDLLTFEDLEMLRNRVSHNRGFGAPHSSNITPSQTNNRRFLIVTYTAEFDRIHYPLALEYSGLPDPKILQETIKRLEKQVSDLEHQSYGGNMKEINEQIDTLQKKVVDVTTENILLKEQIKALTNMNKTNQSYKDINMLKKTLHNLEVKLKVKTNVIENLKKENYCLSVKLDNVMKTERCLQDQLKRYQFVSHSKQKGQTSCVANKSLSPIPTINRSLEKHTENPFSRYTLRDRNINSARSSFEGFDNISSEDSLAVFRNRKGRPKRYQFMVSPRTRSGRSLSPSLSELSHESEISRCACKRCLNSKLNLKEDSASSLVKKRVKGGGNKNMMQRIQSLEKLVNAIILN